MTKRLCRTLFCAAVAFGLSACKVGLDTPSDAQIACRTSADCPSGWRCNPNRQRCQAGDTNSVPVVTVRGAPAGGRGGATQAFEVEVSDADGAPAGTSLVDLTVSYTLDGSTFCAATLAAPAVDLAATELGATHALSWDLLADSDLGTAQPAACRLPAVQLDRQGDGTASEAAVAYTPGVRLRVGAVDDGTPPATSVAALGEPFAVGNLAATLALELDGPEVSLAVPITVRAVDASADVVDLEVQFRLASDPAGAWRLPDLAGATTNVLSATTLAQAPPSLLVWHTDAPLGTAQVAGGVGLTNSAGVVLRARAIDHGLSGAPTYGPWVEQTLDVKNQSPPVMGSVTLAGGEAGASSSLLYVEYQVTDRQRDPVDVELEWRSGGSATWRPATPYPSVLHSGRHGLASDADSTSTTLHTFVWDVGADLPALDAGVELRIRAADDGSTSAWLVAEVPFPVGIDSVGGFEAVHTETQNLPTGTNLNTPLLLTGDFNGDGNVDLVASTQTTGLRLWPGSASGAFGAPADVAIPSFRGAATTGDFNGDGITDVAVKSRDDDAQIALGGAAGLTVVATPVSSPFNKSPRIGAGDFNGDGRSDLAIGGLTGVRVARSNGNGTFTVDGADLGGGDAYAVTAGDFDGDGDDDLAYAVPSGPGSGDNSGSVRMPMSIRVHLGQKGATTGIVSATAEEAAVGLATTVDATTLHDLVLGAGDLDGDGVDELLVSDIFFIGFMRTRVLGRPGGWQRLAQAEAAGNALAVHWDAPGPTVAQGRVVVATAGEAVAYAYDPAAGLLKLAAQPLLGASVDLAFVDANGDALPDVAVSTGSAGTGAVRVFRQAAAAAIPPGAAAPAGGVSVAPGTRALLAGDLDGDGIADVLVGDAIRGSLHTVAPFLGGSRSDRGTLALSIAADPTRLFPDGQNDQAASNNIGFGDVNGDGALDALLSAESGTYFVATANGPDDPFRFARGKLVGSGATGPGYGPVLTADLDADLRDDAIVHEFVNPWVSRSRGAAGTLTSWLTQQQNPGFPVAFAAVGDLSGDGVPDLVAVNGLAASVAIYVATPGGAGPFAAPCTSAVAAIPASAAVGDVDGDGRNELVLSTTTALVAYGWTGACPLALERSSAAPGALQGLQLVDVNADGVLDAAGVPTGGSPYLLGVHFGVEAQGQATGAFGARVATGASFSAEVWDAADANRDGIPDFYGVDANTLRVYPGARWADRPAWTASLPAARVLAPGAGLGGLDRFGKARTFDLVLRPVVDRASRLTSAASADADFVEAMVRGGRNPLAAGWRAASKAWRLEGDWLTDVALRAAGRVVVPRSRLAALGAGALVEVELPLYGSLPAPSQVRVVCRQTVGFALDGADGLRRTADGRARFIADEEWVELPVDPDGNLATGAGPRYAIAAGKARLLLDRLGVCRVFGLP